MTTTRTFIESTFEMLWDCPTCGSTGLLGVTHRHCPNCGSTQAADGRLIGLG